MNRFTTTKGTLVDGAIKRGLTGTDITYDKAGQRLSAMTTSYRPPTPFPNGGGTVPSATTTHEEKYTYTADGYLATVSKGTGAAMPNSTAEPPEPTSHTLTQSLVRDAMGRVTSRSGDGATRTYTYDARSLLTREEVVTGSATTTTTYDYNLKDGTTYTGAFQRGAVTHSRPSSSRRDW